MKIIEMKLAGHMKRAMCPSILQPSTAFQSGDDYR